MIFYLIFVLMFAVVESQTKPKQQDAMCIMCDPYGLKVVTKNCKMCYWYTLVSFDGDTFTWKGKYNRCGCLEHDDEKAVSMEKCTEWAKRYSVGRENDGDYGCCNDKDLCNHRNNDAYIIKFYRNLIRDKIVCAECRKNGPWIITKNCKYCWWYGRPGENMFCGCMSNEDSSATSLDTCSAWAAIQQRNNKISGCCNDKDVCNLPMFHERSLIAKLKEISCADCSSDGIKIVTNNCKICYWYSTKNYDYNNPQNIKPIVVIHQKCGCLAHGDENGKTIDKCTQWVKSKNPSGQFGNYGCCNDKNLCNYPKRDLYYERHLPQIMKEKIICAHGFGGDPWTVSKTCKYCYWYDYPNYRMQCGCLTNENSNARSLDTCREWAAKQQTGYGTSSGCCDDKDMCNHPRYIQSASSVVQPKSLSCAHCLQNEIRIATNNCKYCYYHVDKHLRAGCGCVKHGGVNAESDRACDEFAKQTSGGNESLTHSCCRDANLCNFPSNNEYYKNKGVDVIVHHGKVVCAYCHGSKTLAIAEGCVFCYWYAVQNGSDMQCGCLKKDHPKSKSLNSCRLWAAQQELNYLSSGCCNNKHMCNHPKFYNQTSLQNAQKLYISCAYCLTDGIKIVTKNCKYCFWFIDINGYPGCGCVEHGNGNAVTIDACKAYAKLIHLNKKYKKDFGCCQGWDLCNLPHYFDRYKYYFKYDVYGEKLHCAKCNSGEIRFIGKNCVFCYWYAVPGEDMQCGCLKKNHPKSKSLNSCNAWAAKQKNNYSSNGCCDFEHKCNHPMYHDEAFEKYID